MSLGIGWKEMLLLLLLLLLLHLHADHSCLRGVVVGRFRNRHHTPWLLQQLLRRRRWLLLLLLLLLLLIIRPQPPLKACIVQLRLQHNAPCPPSPHILHVGHA